MTAKKIALTGILSMKSGQVHSNGSRARSSDRRSVCGRFVASKAQEGQTYKLTNNLAITCKPCAKEMAITPMPFVKQTSGSSVAIRQNAKWALKQVVEVRDRDKRITKQVREGFKPMKPGTVVTFRAGHVPLCWKGKYRAGKDTFTIDSWQKGIGGQMPETTRADLAAGYAHVVMVDAKGKRLGTTSRLIQVVK